MTTSDQLKELQKKALQAVADMPEGELKTRAFEIFLKHLLDAQTQASAHRPSLSERAIQKPTKSSRQPGTVKSRILLLKDEKFFEVPKTIKEVKD